MLNERCCFRVQVFKPDKMNGFDVQSDAEAMLERQRRDIMPRITSTPRTPATPASGLRSVTLIIGIMTLLLDHVHRILAGSQKPLNYFCSFSRLRKSLKRNNVIESTRISS